MSEANNSEPDTESAEAFCQAAQAITRMAQCCERQASLGHFENALESLVRLHRQIGKLIARCAGEDL